MTKLEEMIQMRTNTPEEMAALAASASSALESVEYGAPIDERVAERLRGAEQFCEYLRDGIIARTMPAKLSATSVAEGEFLELVFQFEDQERLREHIPTVLKNLNAIQTAKKPNIGDVAKLRDFFFNFATRLNATGGLHRKVASEIG